MKNVQELIDEAERAATESIEGINEPGRKWVVKTMKLIEHLFPSVRTQEDVFAIGGVIANREEMIRNQDPAIPEVERKLRGHSDKINEELFLRGRETLMTNGFLEHC
ncbi:MAG: hypothetical protein ACK4UN_17280, partial [Limisphaerales bacterium]